MSTCFRARHATKICGMEQREPRGINMVSLNVLVIVLVTTKDKQFLEVIVIALTLPESSRKYKVGTNHHGASWPGGRQQVCQGRLISLLISCTSSDRSTQAGLCYDHRQYRIKKVENDIPHVNNNSRYLALATAKSYCEYPALLSQT